MSNKITVFDTTLRDGEQAPECGMNYEEKMKVAGALAKLGVNIIEAGFPGSSEGDKYSVNQIARLIDGPVICGLARCADRDIEAAARALEPAIERGKGRIHVFIATSKVHMEHKLKKSEDEVIEKVVNGVRLARRFTDDVQFSCEDFSRSDLDYTVKVIKAAIEAGAGTINLPDTVGYGMPWETMDRVAEIIRRVSSDVVYSMHAHDDLNMGTANTLAAIKSGVRQVEVTLNGFGERAGNTPLESVVAALVERKDAFGLETDIDTKEIVPISHMLYRILGLETPLNKSLVGRNAFRESSGVHTDGDIKTEDKKEKAYLWIDARRYGARVEMPLTARSGSSQVEAKLIEKGFSYDGENMDELMERYKEMADNRRVVYDDNLLMAVRGDEEIPSYFRLNNFKPSLGSGLADNATVEIGMLVDGIEQHVKAEGNGMINATENALNMLTGLNVKISDYFSESAEEGSDAEGIERVLVRNNGYCVMGRGMDSDVVRGTAKALVDASNRIRYIMENK